MTEHEEKYKIPEMDPMVGQYSDEFVLEALPSSSNEVFHPYTPESHAEITFRYFKKLRTNHKFNDVTLEINEKPVITANRLILSAYSFQLEAALLGFQQSSQVTLSLEQNVLNIDSEDIIEIVGYMYSGTIAVSKKLRKTAEALGCKHLLQLLNVAEDKTIILDQTHALHFQRKLQIYRVNGWFLDCNILVQNKGTLKCHRLVLCAHSLNIEESLIDTARTSTVHLDLDHFLMKASAVELRNIIEFTYCGEMRGTRRRYSMLRAAAFDLGVMRLYEMLNAQLAAIAEEDNIPIEEDFTPFELDQEANDFHLEPSEDIPEAEEEPEYENGEEYQQSLEDVTAQATEDYVSIYEEYVLGPRRGRRGGTYGMNRPSQSLLMKGNTVVSLSEPSDSSSVKEVREVPALVVSYTPITGRKRRFVDSYGYGLPEYQSTSDIEVPLLLGNQKELMDKPFKCPYCDQRAREKAGIEKHVRSVHTGESPYKCSYCHMCFKVQSNLVRHIRTHTGEKPYACKKCGVAYADKKNMDAHIFREHLKTQPIICSFHHCGKRFWRHDRFSSHCLKTHGALPSGYVSLNTDHV